MADTVITSLASGLETAINQAVQNAVSGGQPVQQSQAQQSVNSNVITTPAPDNYGATPTDASSVSDPMAKTGNMKTGEYVNPYQAEQQQLVQQLGGAKLYETPQETQNIMKGIFASQTEKYNYAAENDPLVKAARANLETQVTNMVAKRGFKYGSANDIINTQITKMLPQFEQISRGEHADFLDRQLNLANTIMSWEKIQFDRSKNQIQLLTTKLETINKMADRDFAKFKVMIEARNTERSIWLQQQKFELAKKLQENQMALDRIENLGYVDEEASVALGVPVGAKAKWAQQMAIEYQNKLDMMAKENDYNLRKQALDVQYERELYELKGQIDLQSQLKIQAMNYQYKKDLLDIDLAKDVELARIAAEKKAEAEAKAAARKAASAAKKKSSSGTGTTAVKSNYTLDREFKATEKVVNETIYKAVDEFSWESGGNPTAKVLSKLKDLYAQGASPEVITAVMTQYGY